MDLFQKGRTNFNTTTPRVISPRGAFSNIKNILTGDNTGVQMVLLVVIVVALLGVLYMVKNSIKSYYNKKASSPYIVKGTKKAKNSLVVTQDPSDSNSITLYRSDGEEGIEFSYSLWMLIENLEYNYGDWKHVFHKGNKSSYPNRAPGVWIHPRENKLRVYMNTYEDILEYIDIDNIPVKKWIHLAIILTSGHIHPDDPTSKMAHYLDVYFNGKLRKRHVFKTLPRQNYGNLWVNLFGGFEGYLSKFRYFNYALDYENVEKIVKEGPSQGACGETGELPPYLENSWWFDI